MTKRLDFESRIVVAIALLGNKLFEFACLITKNSVINKTQTQNGAQTLYFNLLQNSALSMKLLYLDVLLHAPLTSSNLHLTHASFVFS